MPDQPETAAQLIDSLLAEGEEVDAGSFTIDMQAAGTKLETFQYADRSMYLLPIFEAMIRLGGRAVSVDRRGPDLFLCAEGVELSEPLEGLAMIGVRVLGQAASARDQALARMCVGVDMARGGEGVERVVVSYDTGAARFFAEFGAGEPRFGKAPPREPGQLRVLIDYAGLGLGLSDPRARELGHLRRGVGSGSIPVFLDGEKLNADALSRDDRVEGEGLGYRFEAAIDYNRGQIELWTGGVLVEVLPNPPDGFLGRLHLDSPRWDLSQMKLVHDEAVEAGCQDLFLIREQLRRERKAASEARDEARAAAEAEREQAIRAYTSSAADEVVRYEAEEQARKQELLRRFPPAMRVAGGIAYILGSCCVTWGFWVLGSDGEGAGLFFGLGLPVVGFGSWVLVRSSDQGSEMLIAWPLAAVFLSALLGLLLAQ